MADFDPLDVIRDDLKEDDVGIQLSAVKEMKIVAQALGPRRSTEELLQLLDDYCFPVEVQASKSSEAYSNTDALNAKEEVLVEIAAQLTPDFLPLLTVGIDGAVPVFRLLEKLAMVEETVIRQQAVKSLNSIIISVEPPTAREGLRVCRALAEGEWFTSKISASGLTASLYVTLITKEDRDDILGIHSNLCSDDMPMVKASAYKNLVPLIEKMDPTAVLDYVKPLVSQLLQELREEMRETVVDILLALAIRDDEEKTQDVVCQLAQKASDDESWRVRKALVSRIGDVCPHLSENHISDDLIPTYIKLLTDVEPEVRKEGIKKLSELLEKTDGAATALALTEGTISQLASDSNPEVREALGEQLVSLGLKLNGAALTDRLLPVLKQVASDESPQARLNLCSRLKEIANLLGIDVFETEILPLLAEMTIDQKWRVRNSIVSNIAHIGIAQGADRFGSSKLKEILTTSLKDPAAQVRLTACEQVQSLHEEFGFDWMDANFFPEMIRVYHDSTNYLHRMVPVFAVGLLAPSLTSEQIQSRFGDILLKSLKEEISNVKFGTCRVFIKVLPRLDNETRKPYVEILQRLVAEDGDPDVKYYGQLALDAC